MPFRVLQKQEHRRPWHPLTSVLKDVEIHVYGNVYKIGFNKRFTVNNIVVSLPFRDNNGVIAQRIGSSVSFTTQFGLQVQYDGNWQNFVYLCDSYAGHVCGLCGNADGNRNNDFVDRQGVQVSTSGDYFSRFYKWGSKWKYGQDNTIDKDGRS